MSGTDFYAEPLAYLAEKYQASERCGVWHFTPDDWAVLADAISDPPPQRSMGDQLFGLDSTISEQFTSPPELVLR